MNDFLSALERFFRSINQEYVPCARGEIVTILTEVYTKGSKESTAMGSILEYIKQHFPDHEESIGCMEGIWEREVSTESI